MIGSFKIWGLGAMLCTAGWGQGHRDRPSVERGGPGEMRPHSWIRGDRGATPGAGTVPGYFNPTDIRTAYGFSSSGGTGVTIAVVDAYDAPNAEADLGAFSTAFSLPACTTANVCFSKVNQTGGTTYPNYNSGWEGEISLDIQWVHAVAPFAHILLVEAKSASTSDLLAAVNYAKQHASVVSMSWGGGESRSENRSDSTFTQSGVTFLASSGDTGGQVEWPSSSPNVIAVGGTNLAAFGGHLASPVVETAWSGSGGGCSRYESKVAAQNGFLPSSCKNRAVPDVSISGGATSAVSVYISKQGGWFGFYGTSLSVQLYAGFVGVVNSSRVSPMKSTLSDLYAAAAGEPSSSPYTSNFRDITAGSAGGFTAGTGWDFTTGLGSPMAGALGVYLAGKP